MFRVARYYGTMTQYFMAKTSTWASCCIEFEKPCYCSQRLQLFQPFRRLLFISTTCNQLGSVCATQIYDFVREFWPDGLSIIRRGF